MELTILGALGVLLGVFAYALVVALTGLFFTLMEEPPAPQTPPDTRSEAAKDDL